jgi:serine protease
MQIQTFIQALGISMLLVACSGGGGGGGGDGVPDAGGGSFSISGTVSAASNVVIDSDTNDPESVLFGNNTLGTAQIIGNPVMVGGYVTATPSTRPGARFVMSADPDDVYVVDLVAGQTVNLEVVNTTDADLDLGLYDASGALVDFSVGVTRFETVTATTAGRYFIQVNAFSGESNYVLAVGTGVTTASSLSLVSDFLPGEAVVQFQAAAVKAAGGVSALGYQVKAGALERPMLVSFAGLRTAVAVEHGMPEPLSGTRMSADQEAKLQTLYRIKALQGRADVLSADPNYLVKTQKTPNDPYYGLQWHYPLINLPQAWDFTTGTPASGDVVVAVIDTGVMLAHADLSAKLLRDGVGNVVGYDFVSNIASSNDGDGIDPNANDPGDESTPSSSSWHGTHVAGTVAAGSDNGVGVSGVSWGARIMPVRVIGKNGGSSYDVMQGIRYAAGMANDSGTLPARRADIINLSLGCQNCFSASEQTLFNQVRAAGVIVVAAAGNESTSQLLYPASYAGVVSVSAVAIDSSRAPYSNFGSMIDVAAPGGDISRDRNADGYADGILSTLVSSSLGSDYRFYQGTSMAAPQIAGVVALMKAVHPGLTPSDFDAMLASGLLANDLGAAGRDDVYGWGLIDAAKAVLAAQSAASGVTSAALSAKPGRIDFGAVVPTATLELTKLGSGSLAVASVVSDEAWLTVTPAAIDANGLGSYTLNVGRSGLGAGSYSATVTATSNTGTVAKIPVSMQVGTGPVQANSGRYWILLMDENSELVQQVATNGTNGQYDFRFDGLAAGTYTIFAGTDSNWDDFICDDGEVCGAYPTLGLPATLEVSGDRHGLDFNVGLVSSPSTLAVSASKDRFKLRHDGRSASGKGVK